MNYFFKKIPGVKVWGSSTVKMLFCYLDIFLLINQLLYLRESQVLDKQLFLSNYCTSHEIFSVFKVFFRS